MTTQNDLRDSVERKIQFYRIDAGIDLSGIPVPFDPRPALEVIGSLPFVEDEAGRYQFDSNGNAMCVVQYGFDSQKNVTVRFGKTRRTGLPQQELGGETTDLNLPVGAGLLEAIHVVFFPNNVVGCEYNHYGPRISRLGDYFQSKTPDAVQKAKFLPLIRKDFVEQLNRLDEMTLFELRIHPSHIEYARRANESLGEAFASTASIFGDPSETVQLILRPGSGRQARARALNQFLPIITELLRQIEFLANVRRFQIRGKCRDTNQTETIDFLKSQLISKRKIVRMNYRSRALVPESAYAAISEAYAAMRTDIEEAAGISI